MVIITITHSHQDAWNRRASTTTKNILDLSLLFDVDGSVINKLPGAPRHISLKPLLLFSSSQK